ncbi:unnamed protein product [Clavelina lepadiformis]|uniref:MARVEL domain-containing protein n=1 Tax=Clavelina lepadiformis TaxID=159417 RepID=A0ABP0GGR3_CLALP
MCLWITAPDERNRHYPGESAEPAPFTLNKAYPKTRPAILKIFQAIFGLVAFLCAFFAPWWTDRSVHAFRYLEFVCQWHVWSVIFLYILVLLNVHYRLSCIDWALTELIHYVFAVIFFFTAAISAAVFAANSSMIAATVFAFFALALYGAGAYMAYQEWKEKGAHRPAFV